MNKEMSYEDKLKEELELVKCDLHNAYNWLNTKLKEIAIKNNELIEKNNKIIELQQENKQLKDNWNKLKEWLFGEKMMFYNGGDGSRLIRYYELCNKMQELEKGDD